MHVELCKHINSTHIYVDFAVFFFFLLECYFQLMINVLITCVYGSLKKKEKKRLLLCIHYVYLSLAGGGLVLRMNIFVHSVLHTMAPFTASIWPPVHDRGTVISNPWNAPCSFNEFNIQQRGRKENAVCVLFRYTKFTFPSPSPPNYSHGGYPTHAVE